MTSFLKEAYKKSRNFALRRSDIEVLVREATSNEKWGPSGTQMSQIAMATHNYNDFNIIMNTLWERLNDDGKNWRHIYKALLVIDYLLRNGSERVITECRARIIEIKTLTEFQRITRYDKDVGLSVRERAKQIVELLNDEKRLQAERQKAAKNRDKYNVAISSDGPYYHHPSPYQSHSTAHSDLNDVPTAPVTSFRTRRSSSGSSPRRNNNAPRSSPRKPSVSGESDSVDSNESQEDSLSGSESDNNEKNSPRTKSATTTSNTTRQATTSAPRRPSGGKTSNTVQSHHQPQVSTATMSNPSVPPANTADPLFELLTSSSPPKQTSSSFQSFSTNSTFNTWAPLAPTTTTTPSMTNSSITTNPPIVSTPTLASPYSNINPSTVNFNPRFADDDWADFTKASISTPSTSTGPAPVSTTTAAVTISSTTTTNLSSAPTTQSTANDSKILDPWKVKPDLIELDLGPSGKTDFKTGGTTGTSYRLTSASSNTTGNPFLIPMPMPMSAGASATQTSNVTASSLPSTPSPTAMTTTTTTTAAMSYSGLGMMYNPIPTSTMPIYQGMYTYPIPTTTTTTPTPTTTPSATITATTPVISNPNRYPTTTNPTISFRN